VVERPWDCVVCGRPAMRDPGAPVDREGDLCTSCGSTWRIRAIALGALLGLGLPRLPLPRQSPDWSRRALGVSDSVVLSAALGSRVDYTNSYYHRFPRLDLLDVPPDVHGTMDLVTCSDVLEHVPPPADRALTGVAALLRPGGAAVLSVPCDEHGSTREFYPGLTYWEAVPEGVSWIDAGGARHVDETPEYHGGPGQTLAFRLWGVEDLKERLAAVGLVDLQPLPDHPEVGVPFLAGAGVWTVRRGEEPARPVDPAPSVTSPAPDVSPAGPPPLGPLRRRWGRRPGRSPGRAG